MNNFPLFCCAPQGDTMFFMRLLCSATLDGKLPMLPFIGCGNRTARCGYMISLSLSVLVTCFLNISCWSHWYIWNCMPTWKIFTALSSSLLIAPQKQKCPAPWITHSAPFLNFVQFHLHSVDSCLNYITSTSIPDQLPWIEKCAHYFISSFQLIFMFIVCSMFKKRIIIHRIIVHAKTLTSRL